MSLQQILRSFDTIGPMGPRAPITIDPGFTGSAEVTAAMRASLGTDSLTIDAVTDLTERGDDHLRVTGTASLLGMTDAPVTFSATEPDGALLVTLEVRLTPDWSFRTLFPDLPREPLAEIDDETGEKLTDPHFLDRLSLGTSRLVFASRSHTDAALGGSLLAGLSFAGELYFMGVLWPVSLLLDDTAPVPLTGPLKEYRTSQDPTVFSGIRLAAPITTPMTQVGPLRIERCSVFLKSGFDEQHVDLVPSATQRAGIYFLMDAVLGGRPLEVVGRYDTGTDSEELWVRGTFRDFALAGFSDLSQQVGVDGFDGAVPESFPAPEGLALTELGTRFSTGTFAPSTLMLGVGMDTHWEIVPNVLRLEEVGLRFMVMDPFGPARRILTTVSGLFAFPKFSLAATADFPEFRMTAGLPAGETLPLGDVVESFLGEGKDVPPLTVSRLRLEAAPRTGSFLLDASIQDLLSLAVGATAFEVSSLSLVVDRDGTAGRTRGMMAAQMRMGGATVVLSGEVSDRLTLSGALKSFDLKEFWSLVTDGDTLPDEVPDVVIQNLAVSLTPSTGDFSLLGSVTVAWDHLSKTEALSTNLQFSFKRRVVSPGTSTFTASISLQGEGPLHVAEGFTLKSFNFLLDYDTLGGWKLSGGMGAELLEANLYLSAGWESTPAGQKLKLLANASPAADLVDLGGFGAFQLQQLDLLFDFVTEGEDTRVFYNLRAATFLKVGTVYRVGGFLTIRSLADGSAALLFNPTEGAAAEIPFPTGDGMALTLALFEVGMVRESALTGWAFTGTATVGFTGFPDWLGKVLPSRLTAKAVVSRTQARLTAVNVTDAVAIPLGEADGKPLGDLYLQMTELGISLMPSVGLVLEAGIGFPAELNAFLDSQVLRVYQKGNYTTMARARFTIAETGIAIQLVTSPFTGMSSVRIDGGDDWFEVDMGEFGAIALKMPTFVYDGVTQYFEAAGGVRISRPLAVPMTPLKWFLDEVGMKGAAEVFPDAIPITEIRLVDENDDLRVEELIAFVRKAGDVPDDVVKVMRSTGKLLNRFPDGFKHYLDIEVPGELEFRWGFSPGGRVSMSLLAGQSPVKLLFSSVVPGIVPMPGLVGLELRKVTLGTISAGTLFFGEIDAVIDMFDLPSLALSLMLPNDPDFPLPTSDQLQRRVTLENVFCVIPAAQGEPFPIPVFYDRIGFDYLGIEGIGIGAHVSFPRPELGGAEAAAMFGAFQGFLSDKKTLLDPATPPAGVELAFTFRDEFLQAPEYLGGKTLGTKGKDVRVGSWRYVAEAMNFCKTFSLQRTIASIPIENRVGSSEHRFAFLRFDADWLLTTPAEFRAGAFGQLRLSAGDVEDFVAVLPSVAASGGGTGSGTEEGLVAFIRGEADIGFVKLETVFGLAASGSMGFDTGFKMSGAIGPIELELDGAVKLSSPLTVSASAPVAAAPQASTAAIASAAASAAGRGKALSLNGKNAWVQVPASDSLVLPQYTVEVWLRPTQKASGEWLEVFGVDTLQGGCQRNFYVEINNRTSLYVHRFKDARSGTTGPDTPGGSVGWGRWQHLAITNDGVTAKTYLDGVELASGGVTGGLTALKADLFMGKVPGAANDKFLQADLAEARVWKRARTGDEIRAEMRSVLAGDERDLVSCWRFDSDTGATAVDVCGRNHGVIHNGAWVASDLLSLQGLALDGKGDYLEVPDSHSLRVKAYTVEAWIRPSQPAAEWVGVVGKKGRNHALFLHRSGFVHHRFHDGGGWNGGAPNTPTGVFAWDRWTHVAITNDGKTARTYVNGVKQAEGAVNGDLVVHGEPVQIGRTADAANDQFFPGSIAEVRVWSRARTEDEVKGAMYRRLAGTEADLVSLWRPGEAAGETLTDACARNAGVFHVAGRAEPVRLRHDGLIFDGKDDFALAPRSERWKLPTYSVEAWIRPDANPTRAWQCVLGGNGRAPKLYVNSSGAVSHRFVDTGTVVTQSFATGVPKNVQVPDPKGSKEVVGNTAPGQVRWAEWNHLAITNDGATWRTFVNGVQAASGAVSGNVLAEAVELNVGRSHLGTSDAFFAGSIDDVRVWSVARTAEQIQADMSFPLTGKETGLVAWYDMDHTSGSRMVDLGAGKVDAAVYGARWSLAAAPAEPERAALQVQGHTQLTVAGHRAMTGDLRIVDGDVWFRGVLDLFPRDWPLRVYGNVEGTLNGSRFYLSGDADVALAGMSLASARAYVSNQEMRVEGRFLGAYAMLDVTWAGSDPTFRGSIGIREKADLRFGAVYLGGVKVSDDVRLTLDLDFGLAIQVDRRGFGADVTARFEIGGTGFSLQFHISVAPSDLSDMVNWVKQRIIDAPEKYLAHLFADAAAWLASVASGAVDFAKDAGEAIGRALKQGFGVAKEDAARLMKAAGYGANVIGGALSRGYELADSVTTALMKGAGIAVEEIGRFLKDVLNHPDQAAAQLLKDAGYAAAETGKALRAAYGYAAAKAAETAAAVLRSVKYIAEDVGAALRYTFGKDVNAAAKILKGAGYPADEVGKALNSAYRCGEKAAASAMKAAEFTADETAKALRVGFGATAQVASDAMKAANYGVDVVSNSMVSVYDQSRQEADRMVKGITSAASDATRAVTSATNTATQTVTNVANDAAKGATSVAKDVGKTTSKGLKKVGKVFGI